MLDGLMGGLSSIGGVLAGGENGLSPKTNQAVAGVGMLGNSLMSAGAPRGFGEPRGGGGGGFYNPMMGLGGGGLLGMLGGGNLGIDDLKTMSLLGMLGGGGQQSMMMGLLPMLMQNPGLLKGTTLGAAMPQNWETTVTPAGSHPNAT